MTLFTETTPAAEWRAYVSNCHDNGIEVDSQISLAVAVADILDLPDDMPLLPAVCAAMTTPTQLNDAGSVAYTKKIAHAAGRGVLVAGSLTNPQ
jgi:hypothetical protein